MNVPERSWCLRMGEVMRADIVHYYDSSTGDVVRSKGNRFEVRWRSERFSFTVPLRAWKRLSLPFRLGRRLLRTDKSSAVPNRAGDGLVVLYDGAMMFFDFKDRSLRRTGKLANSRNALHCSIAVTEHGIYVGEYGANPQRRPVPIWRSTDDGRSWQVVHRFPAKSIKHIHGVYHDPYTDRLWVTTGDFAGECLLVSADPTFEDIQVYGDGSQSWRPVSLFFTPDHVIWAMDSPLETCFLQVFDRKTGGITARRSFPGPVWYTKRLTDGIALLQTTVEIGPGVRSKDAQLFASQDLLDWQFVARFAKDRWPMPWFKLGVIAFADGPQSSRDFVIFGEALHGLDGCAVHSNLVQNRA